MSDTSKTATLTIDGESYDLPIYSPTAGPDVIDIRKLYGQTGNFTFDPGYKSTASCESSLTYIDGNEGVLLHRGYPIGQLAEHSSFMEVSYLLLNGELPEKDELDNFTNTITYHTMLHDQMRQFYQGFRRDAHPMAIMCGVVGALSAFYHDSTDISDPEHRKISATHGSWGSRTNIPPVYGWGMTTTRPWTKLPADCSPWMFGNALWSRRIRASHAGH